MGRRTDPKLQDELLRGQERTGLMPTSAITVREHLELEIAAHVRYLELNIANSAKTLELQIAAQGRLFESIRAEAELRYMQLRNADDVALKAALVSAEKAFQASIASAKEAVLKAEIATDKRLSLLNELREGVATREQIQALEQRLSDIKERVDKNESLSQGRQSGIQSFIGWILAAIAVAGFAITALMRH